MVLTLIVQLSCSKYLPRYASSYNNTYFLNLTSDTWTPGPDMSFKRHFPACHLVRQPQSGEREIVIVGGRDRDLTDHCQFQKTVEILNLNTNTLRNGEWSSHILLSS